MSYDVSKAWMVAILIAAIWDIFWKIKAAWRASQNKQLGWFIAILVINSIGILPIIYLLLNRKEYGHGSA